MIVLLSPVLDAIELTIGLGVVVALEINEPEERVVETDWAVVLEDVVMLKFTELGCVK